MLIDRLSSRLQNHPKRVVFAEGADYRIIQAARLFATRQLGVPILVGDRSVIKENASRLNINLEGMRILDPSRSDEIPSFILKVKEQELLKEMEEEDVRNYVLQNNYFATLLLESGGADALISGATTSISSALKPILRLIPRRDGVTAASSLMILEKEDSRLGIQGLLFMGDCGVIPNPNAAQLSDISITIASIAHHLTNEIPRVAFLAYSTKSEVPGCNAIAKTQEALTMAQEKAKLLDFRIEIDGEMQVDAALDPEIAKFKNIQGQVAGQANVLIFPDLNSGNITSKMVQIVAGCRCYGQIITGLTKPVAEISRGASAHDIFGTSVIVSAQAVDRELLFM